VDHKTESVLGYPSVRRVVDSIFGVSDAPLSFTDALSGSFAIFLLAFFCFVAVRQIFARLTLKYSTKRHPYVVRRNAAKRNSVAANDPGPKRGGRAGVARGRGQPGKSSTRS
jgi:hypothetical protein